jgi:tRNA-splicing ligase RtcB (3'-phosphate/5'-hydroxy nucleic acid ligase)
MQKTTPACRNFCEEDSLSWHSGVQARALPVGLHFSIKGVSIVTDEKIKLQKIDDYRWRIPREGKMRTDGVIYSDERLFSDIRKDQSLVQVANVAWLPGIVGHSLAMPDIHWGYGFPIGGVAGFDMDEGVVSPGGVGYDIN